MEDERGGAEERKADETKHGGEGADRQAQATSQVGIITHIKINLRRFLAEYQYKRNFLSHAPRFWICYR